VRRCRVDLEGEKVIGRTDCTIGFSGSAGPRVEERKKLFAQMAESILVQSDDSYEIAVQFKFLAGIK
jgi:hypothetical protein